jgi:pimeloyl-ACP methyl ester carboxylesterase
LIRPRRRPRHRSGHLLGVLAVALIALGCRSAGPENDAGGRAHPGRGTASTTGGDGGEPDGRSVGAETSEIGPDPAGDDGDGGDADQRNEAFEVEPAVWVGCDDGLECATVTVPLDHGDPSGPTIDLALVRVPAPDRDGSGVLGSILVNPGGPGGSGVAFVRGGFRLDPDTMDDHHLVGFDPRGVGASSPLACEPDPPVGPQPDLAPDDATERDDLDRAARALAERCRDLDGAVLPHLGTDSVVEDLDLMRRAVGDELLSYVGLSYGTFVGLHYAQRHPERVGRMVLDGVVDPARPLAGLLAQQAEGFDRVLAEADRACRTTLTCPDGGLVAAYDRIARRLDEDGPVDGVGSTEFAIGTLVGLYAESLWPRLASGLAQADRGDLAGMGGLHRLYVGAADVAAYNAVICTDGPVPLGADGWDRLESELADRSARFGRILANEVRACAHWPVRSTAAPEPVAPARIAPVLVLSTTGDAATPVENAVAVAAALPGAGLVTVADTSHTAYGRNFCVERIVADYLATGRVPPAVHRC